MNLFRVVAISLLLLASDQAIAKQWLCLFTEKDDGKPKRHMASFESNLPQSEIMRQWFSWLESDHVGVQHQYGTKCLEKTEQTILNLKSMHPALMLVSWSPSQEKYVDHTSKNNPSTAAQFYKCREGDRVVYRDQPCKKTNAGSTLAPSADSNEALFLGGTGQNATECLKVWYGEYENGSISNNCSYPVVAVFCREDRSGIPNQRPCERDGVRAKYSKEWSESFLHVEILEPNYKFGWVGEVMPAFKSHWAACRTELNPPKYLIVAEFRDGRIQYSCH